jgi:GNAT superfamily N-acetyltransferase
MADFRIVDVTDTGSFGLIPPCADARFDHRTCDYWEDADRGTKASRPGWLEAAAPKAVGRAVAADNPFAPPPAREASFNPFDPRAALARADDLFGGHLGNDASDDASPGVAADITDDPFGVPADNPFAPKRTVERPVPSGVPRKLALLDRGRGVFGSYAKTLLVAGESVAYTQFGPLSAYPRAVRLRDLYPQLPSAPLPAVITCIATTAEARRQGHARRLVEAVCEDLAERGFSAVEAYPDLTRSEDEQSGGRPAFWHGVGFTTAVDDERFPVMRRALE